MLNYALRRLLLMIPTLLLITAVIFAVVKLAPGNPFSVSQGASERAVSKMDSADYQSMLARYGLDKPWYVQYGRWVKMVLSGSLGDSFSERRPVNEVLFSTPGKSWAEAPGIWHGLKASCRTLFESKLGATLFLNSLALLAVLLIAIPLGLYSAVRRGGWVDRISGVLLYALYSLPNYWIAVLLILLVGVKLQWLPFYGMHGEGAETLSGLGYLGDALAHAALPAVCLAYGSLAFMARFSRGAMLEVLKQDYMRTARAKGLPERTVLLRHGLRSALVPFVTLFGLMLPELVAGSVIVETIFAWPGLGQMFVKAIYTRDYPLILAECLLGALLVLVGTLLSDLGYAWADPRVRLEETA